MRQPPTGRRISAYRDIDHCTRRSPMSVSRVFRRLVTLAVRMVALIGAGTVAASSPAHAASWPPVGSTVCHVARVSGTLCGVVTAVNVVIAYPDGSTDRVFLYNACAQPGDG